jgi:hypothetical protein
MNLKVFTPELLHSGHPVTTLAKLNLAYDDLLIVHAKEDSVAASTFTMELAYSMNRRVILLIGDNEKLAAIKAKDLKAVLGK